MPSALRSWLSPVGRPPPGLLEARAQRGLPVCPCLSAPRIYSASPEPATPEMSGHPKRYGLHIEFGHVAQDVLNHFPDIGCANTAGKKAGGVLSLTRGGLVIDGPYGQFDENGNPTSSLHRTNDSVWKKARARQRSSIRTNTFGRLSTASPWSGYMASNTRSAGGCGPPRVTDEHRKVLLEAPERQRH